MFEILFFAKCLGRGELRFFAMGRTAVLLVHHFSQQPDLFTAQEAEHQSFVTQSWLARF
jgi:hypothetical protein